MADRTKIQWTEASWNPIRAEAKATGKIGWFCTHASPGCVNCYSEAFNARLGTQVPFKAQHAGDVITFLDEKMLLQPIKWTRPRQIFPCSMTDLFGEFVTDGMLDRIFAAMALTPHHTYQVLTKRAERMRSYLSHPTTARRVWELACDMAVEQELRVLLLAHGRALAAADHFPGRLPRIRVGRWPLPNVWLGVSVEDQRRADERIVPLLNTPAALHWISFEPLLERVVVPPTWFIDTGAGTIGWAVIGGESGPKAREYRYSWGASLIEQCAEAGVPAFHKQVGARPFDDISHPGTMGRSPRLNDKKGGDPAEWPEELRVRQMPALTGRGA